MTHTLARLILDWLRSRGVVHTAEPSFKLSRAGLGDTRALYGFGKAQLGDAADDVLLEFCTRLGMPASLRAHYGAALAGTGYVGFGYEGDGGIGRYKAYLDLSSRLVPAAPAPWAGEPSRLQFLGYKWCVGDDRSAVLTEYRLFTQLTRRAMRRRALQLLGDLAPAQAVIEAAFAACVRDWPERPLEYMEAREPGNPRVSFDLKFYSTSMTLSAILPELRALCDALGLGHVAQATLDANAGSRLGHLAGGLDRGGTPYLMVYHGVRRHVGAAC
jgi:hypothetical protein